MSGQKTVGLIQIADVIVARWLSLAIKICEMDTLGRVDVTKTT